jgi:hypothetical protein
MTSDPERLLAQTGGESALSRELLASFARAEPPAGARDAAWSSVARQIALLGAASAGVSAAAASASAAGGATAPLGAKAMILLKLTAGLGVGAAGVGLVAGSLAEAPAPIAAQPVTRVAPAPIPAKREPRVVQAEAVSGCRECDVGKAPSSAITPRPPTDAERADLLGRESALLVKARAALRASNVAEASALLSRLESQFPRGMLAQEREVLRIELLAARGDRKSAAARARAFIAANPKSPHSAKLARFSNER